MRGKFKSSIEQKLSYGLFADDLTIRINNLSTYDRLVDQTLESPTEIGTEFIFSYDSANKSELIIVISYPLSGEN